MVDLVVIGTGGLAREIAMLAAQINERRQSWLRLGYVSASCADVGRRIGALEVFGDDVWIENHKTSCDVVIGVGEPLVRADIAERLCRNRFLSFPNLIHPCAVVDWPSLELGCGNVITAGVVLTCDVSVGNFNLCNLNATIGHDVRIGSCNVVNPGSNLSGGVELGNNVLVGTGAQLLEGTHVGDGARVGAGAVVTEDIARDVTVVGIPARPVNVGR